MAYSISVKVPRGDADKVVEAAFWCGQFYPDVESSIAADRVVLSSQSRDETALRAVWASALLNEEQMHAQAGFRGDILDRLSQ